MQYGSKMASDTLIGVENRSERVETVETGLKTGEPSQTAGGVAGASPEGAQAVCTEPSRGTACPAVWHVAAAEKATSGGSVGSKRGSQSGSGRGSGRAVVT